MSDFISEVGAKAIEAELRDSVFRLQEQLAKAKMKTDALVEATQLGAKDAMLAMGPVSKVPAPRYKTDKKKPVEAALWNTSDWQGSKVTPTYNQQIARDRIDQFTDECRRLTQQRRATTTVDQCVVVMGGDMIEGLFNFPNQAFEIDASIFGQYVWVSRKIVDVVRAALATYKKVHVVGEWGNHGRVGSRRDCVPKNDNFDRMCYHLAKELLEDEILSGRLTWAPDDEDIQRLEIGSYRALVLHGDEIGRGGSSSPNTLLKYANNLKSGSFKYHGEFWDFRDLYIHHFHQHAEYPMANGEGAVFMTGSTESDNRYARDSMAASAIPSQRLHFIDPKKGVVVAQHKILLD